MKSATKPLILLGFLYLCSLLSLWPGVMSPDALIQYDAAVSGIYQDHHPPAMSLVWRYLNYIYPGPGLIFCIHLSLLYIAAAVFVYLFRESKFRWWYAVYPLIPNMLAYTVVIVKDSGFVYAYLLAGAIISFLIVGKQNKFKWPLIGLSLCLLFYGTAVKFQAQYLLIFFTLGIGYCTNYKFGLKNILLGIFFYLVILLAIFSLNNYLVPNSQKSHSWQFVKLYDLTAISLKEKTPLYPKFILQNPQFNFDRIVHDFDPQKIDNLVFEQHPALTIGKNIAQRDELWNYWLQIVLEYPLQYIKIRYKLWSYNLTSVPGENNEPTKFLEHTTLRTIVELPGAAKFINDSYKYFVGIFKLLWLLPFLFIYTILGVKNFKISPYSIPLTMFSITSVALLLILFFFSMAGIARYVLLCTCLVHASHGFAYRSWRLHTDP